MRKKCFTFCIAILLGGYCSNAQTSCDSLQRLLQFLDVVLQQNRQEKNIGRRKVLYKSYLSESGKAAAMAGRCFAKTNAPSGSVEHLKNHYLMGKLLYQSGKCEQAHTIFRVCLGNPHSAALKLNNTSTYAQFIGTALRKCNTNQLTEVATTNGYVLEYDGKGGSFIQDMFGKLDSFYFDNTPLSPGEIETIAARTVSATDTIDARLAMQLSGNSDYLLAPPFLFLHGTNDFLSVPIEWKKNLAFGSETGMSKPKLSDFSAFIHKHYNVLQSAYFNRFTTNDKLITVYLNGGSYDERGLKSYLDFCNSIHYRAAKRVAYYMPFDNSIVAWASSGGGTLVHEIIHALIAGDNPKAPLWLNEGLASLYEEANENGNPLNNYRLIFIQQAFIKKGVCINWTDLMDIENYAAAGEMNYNLLSAYSRHFCKFLYDEFGNEALAGIYKNIRDSAVYTAAGQTDLICRTTGKAVDELQKQWQDYLLKQEIPKRWQRLTAGISNEFKKKYHPVFKTSSIQPDEERLRSLKKLHEEYSKKPRTGGSLSNGVGPQQF